MDQYRAQVKSWQRNRMQIGAIAKWPQRTVINAEDCDDIGRQDWEAVRQTIHAHRATWSPAIMQLVASATADMRAAQ